MRLQLCCVAAQDACHAATCWAKRGPRWLIVYPCALQVVVVNMVHAERVYINTATGPGGMAGPLRVDLARGNSEYSEGEARAAYSRTLVGGWVVGG